MIFGLSRFASSRWMQMIQPSTSTPCRHRADELLAVLQRALALPFGRLESLRQPLLDRPLPFSAAAGRRLLRVRRRDDIPAVGPWTHLQRQRVEVDAVAPVAHRLED